MPRRSATAYPSTATQGPRRMARLWLLSITCWTLFSGLLVLQDGISQTIYRPGPIDWIEKVTYEIGWTAWGPLLPCVVAFARRHRVSAPASRRTWLWLAGGALIAILVQVTVETAELLAMATILHKEPPIAKLFASIAFMRWHFDLLIYAAIVAVVQVVTLRREAADLALQASQMEARLAEARLDALKSQIHPHFLFNTLHAIAALVLKSENRLAVEMISRLSDFLRVVLEHAEVQRVSLKEELDLLRLYLDIQMVRFRRLQVSVDVPPQLQSVEVPYLLLQPLVENAIKHGVERYALAGVIEVRAWQQDENIHLVVKNDGGGLTTSAAGAFRERIGLSNTRRRLELLYGDRQQIELRPTPEGGALVEIVLPISESRLPLAEASEEVPTL